MRVILGNVGGKKHTGADGEKPDMTAGDKLRITIKYNSTHIGRIGRVAHRTSPIDVNMSKCSRRYYYFTCVFSPQCWSFGEDLYSLLTSIDTLQQIVIIVH